MRLDFNIILVDDDLADEDLKESVVSLISHIGTLVEEKGYHPKVHAFASPDEIDEGLQTNGKNRIDLYLSDNNLGENVDLGENIQGIDLYLELRKKYVCDFILYTRDTKTSIVSALTGELNKTQDPNLFSRFTFVARETGTVWYEYIDEVLNHILSKREEINNLRGLYAQQISKVENHLRGVLDTSNSLNLQGLINEAFKRKKITRELRKLLHAQRYRRNGIIHNDEQFCDSSHQWFIEYEDTVGRLQKIYERDFLRVRKELSQVVNEVIR